jgi:indolepyruvate ferredoxin oxidoreductase alpha subunit
MEKRELLLGDDAVALAAIHEGISGAYGYPGTPSTELFEYIEERAEAAGIHARWSANEKVAYEEAIGMSFAGKRAIISMKHVGLNVAADAFVNSGVTGANGGLVLAVADDPGMHSSQNEQDSRAYAKFALVPCLEPATQQEAYDMTRYAFRLSEETSLPVVIRLVTRLAHSRADVVTGEQRAQNALHRPSDPMQFTLLPSNSRILYRKLVAKQDDLQARAESSPFNVLDLSPADRSRGIVANGVAWNYVLEAFGGRVPYPSLKVGQSPMPVGLLRQLVDAVPEIVVVEEGYPILEEALRGVCGIPGRTIRGKLDGLLPRTGEMDPDVVGRALGVQIPSVQAPTLARVPGRPPALCQGCGHADTFLQLKEAGAPWGDVRMFADIGCYTLGFYPPFDAVQSCVDMGASISMAAGAAHAGEFPVVCAIGDSTFMHSGMTPLVGAVREDVNMVVFILDNGTVAMTGTQETMATGERLDRVVLGLGVSPDHLKVINPLPKYREENVRTIRAEIEHKGLSVVIARRPCIQAKRRSAQG